MNMRLLTVLVCVLLMSSCVEQKYDLIIRGATVIDGSGGASFLGDVGVNADTIAFIGDLSKAVAVKDIDATGLMLSPGFIDTHSHHDRGMFETRSMIALTSQGVTTMIVGQDGGSQYPLTKLAKVDSVACSPQCRVIHWAQYTKKNALGEKFQRQATQEKVESNDQDASSKTLMSGSLGLSTGLEYDPGVIPIKRK